MMAKHKSCSTTKTDSMIKVEEKGRRAVFRNKSRESYTVTEVDGCLVTSGIRADYVVSKDDTTSVLVELKGKNIEHACAQLFASVEDERVKKVLNHRKGFLVICKRFPRFDTFVARAKIRSAKQYKAGFHVVCDRGEFDIDRVASIDGPY